MHFNGDMGEFMHAFEPHPVFCDRFRIDAQDRDDGTVMSRPQLPDMKVDYFIALVFDGSANLVRQVFVAIVKEHCSAIAQKAPRPAKYDESTNDADQRVEPRGSPRRN